MEPRQEYTDERFEDLLRPREVSRELGRGQLLSTSTEKLGWRVAQGESRVMRNTFNKFSTIQEPYIVTRSSFNLKKLRESHNEEKYDDYSSPT